MAKKPNWQTIDTAPMDGTRVQLRRKYQGNTVSDGEGYFGNVTIRYQDSASQTYENVWVGGDGCHLFPTPTHWMPLPEPPK